MTKETLAACLDGREYPLTIGAGEKQAAKDAGLVVVYGASDDLMEFDGAIYDEAGACHLESIEIDVDGIVPEWEQFKDNNNAIAEFSRYFRRKERCKTITPLWDTDGYLWKYATNIPKVAEFDVMEDREKYCRGFVFSLEDL